MAPPEPLWRALRDALNEHGYSVRGFAKMCHEAAPNASWDSWKRTLNRALDDDPDTPYTPSRATAELWARLLGKPETYFVRPQERETIRAERDRLRVEVERLRGENERLQARRRSG